MQHTKTVAIFKYNKRLTHRKFKFTIFGKHQTTVL